VPPQPKPEEFDSEEWQDDVDFQPREPGERKGRDAYFDDQWGEELLDEELTPGDVEGLEPEELQAEMAEHTAAEEAEEAEAMDHVFEEGEEDGLDDLDDEDFERAWEESEPPAGAAHEGGKASGH